MCRHIVAPILLETELIGAQQLGPVETGTPSRDCAVGMRSDVHPPNRDLSGLQYNGHHPTRSRHSVR
jgi:hypothetical protein